MKWSNPLHRKTRSEAIYESRTLTPEGQTYFSQVRAEYGLLPPNAVPTQPEIEIRKVADEIVKKEPEDHTWADLFALETSVVKLQPELDLRRGAWAIRAKYKDLAGDGDYAAYQASNPPDPRTGNLDDLRSDTEQILREFHWIYAFTPVRERIRNSLAKAIFAITVLFVSIACAIAAYGYFPHLLSKADKANPPSIPVLPIIMAMGMVGGYISLQRRIQALPTTGDPIVNIAELSNSQFSVYLAPLSGAVFAVLLYIIFIGGLLTGPLFPAISTTEGTCESVQAASTTISGAPESAPTASSTNTDNPTVGNSGSIPSPNDDTRRSEHDKTADCVRILSFSDFVTHTGPASGVQFAILLVWAFIAGFAERFVPDTIDRLVSQAVQK